MTKLDDLIAELCPDGVEYKKLGACTQKTSNIKWKNYPNKSFKYIDLSSVEIQTHKIKSTILIDLETAPSRAQQIVQMGDVLLGTTRPMLKRYCIVPEEFDGQICSTGFCVLRADNTLVLDRWLLHVISSKSFFDYVEIHQKGASYPAITDNDVSMYLIPVPPLAVQEEIVRILDAFSELQAELQAELQKRKKQYEYYKNGMFNFENPISTTISKMVNVLCPSGVDYKKLGDIATDIYRGSGIKRDQITDVGIPCVRYGEIYTTYNIHFNQCVSHTDEMEISPRKYFEHGDILFAITGESVEEIAKSIAYLGTEKCLAGGDIVVMKHKQNPKYISYVLSTTICQDQKSKGKVKSKVVHSSVPDISSIVIPVPPLEIQNEIVSILDRFDTLCNDISHGIPAEIERRRKQYEYYRDRLLTFKQKGVSA